jgi:hypothetical protein
MRLANKNPGIDQIVIFWMSDPRWKINVQRAKFKLKPATCRHGRGFIIVWLGAVLSVYIP